MTTSKGIQSKTLDQDSEDEILKMTPDIAVIAMNAATKARNEGKDDQTKLVLQMPRSTNKNIATKKISRRRIIH